MEYLIAVLILVAALTFLYYKKRKPKVTDIEERVFNITDKVVNTDGIIFWYESGVTHLTQREVSAVYSGLSKCFEKSSCKGYTQALSFNNYTIAVVHGIIAPESGLPCYKLPAGVYSGTEWDLGGYILAAGQVVSIGEPDGNIIAIPAYNDTQLERLSTIIEYEAEHVILAWNDGDEYERTKIHGVGTGHPIIPDCI